MKRIIPLLLLAAIASSLPASPKPRRDSSGSEPLVFRAEAVAGDVWAINYRYRGGGTRVAFAGTHIARGANGSAIVANRGGYVEIRAEVNDLPLAQDFGAEYLTYVLWAVSPEGRASNLGEVLTNRRGYARAQVTSDMPVFGMIVTAEPYFAVARPSNVIVLENEVLPSTEGRVFPIRARVDLWPRDYYEPLANPLKLRIDLDREPLELYQARNAIQIAHASGADEYAPETLRKAEASLEMAEHPVITRGKRKEAATLARQSVQFAEDAREIAVLRIDEQALIEEQRRTASERDRAEREARKRRAASDAQARAEREKQAAERRWLEEEQKRLEAELAKSRADAERAKSESARLTALHQRDRHKRRAADADRRRKEAEHERQALRRRLLETFNRILPTRDTERGLVVNLGDLLFDVNSDKLKPHAREKLARLAGTVLAFPGLHLQAEGHSCKSGSRAYNLKLSERRAQAVRGYLLGQDVPRRSVSATGFGFDRPIASNDTKEGRRKNRRVEVVISGEVIGQWIGRRSL